MWDGEVQRRGRGLGSEFRMFWVEKQLIILVLVSVLVLVLEKIRIGVRISLMDLPHRNGRTFLPDEKDDGRVMFLLLPVLVLLRRLCRGGGKRNLFGRLDMGMGRAV